MVDRPRSFRTLAEEVGWLRPRKIGGCLESCRSTDRAARPSIPQHVLGAGNQTDAFSGG